MTAEWPAETYVKVRLLISAGLAVFALQSLAGEEPGVSSATIQAAQEAMEKEAASVKLAGVWAVDQIVTSSDCPELEVGERSSMLLLIDQKRTDLEVSAVGRTSWPSYTGYIYNSGNIQLRATDPNGSISEFQLGLLKDGTVSGKRTVTPSSKPCSAVRKVRAKRVSIDKPW